jgi:hypothetical protein
MKVHGGPSAQALEQMAARAQESKKPFTLEDDTSSSATDSGNIVPPTGQNLPPVTETKGPDHATGLERAIERVSLNLAKHPDSAGLQNALDKLEANLAKHSADSLTDTPTTPPAATDGTDTTSSESGQESTTPDNSGSSTTT